MDRDEQFQELRPLLFSLAYRMLGTRADAEDIVQEAYLRWHSARDEAPAQATAVGPVVPVARIPLDSRHTHLACGHPDRTIILLHDSQGRQMRGSTEGTSLWRASSAGWPRSLPWTSSATHA